MTRSWFLFSLVVLVVCFIVGQMVYMYSAGFGALDAVYFAVVTFSTVGYGDLPVDSEGLPV